MKFKVGDRVMINIKDRYSITVYGSTGKILTIDTREALILFDKIPDYDGTTKKYDISLDHIALLNPRPKSHLPEYL